MSRPSKYGLVEAQIITEELEKGSSYQSAMLKAGLSKHQAKMGRAGIPKSVYRKIGMEAKELARMSVQLTAADQEHVVRGRLLMNTVLGKDSGVMSAKALGSDKRVNMFAADQVNANIIVVPQLPGQIKPAITLKAEDPEETKE